MTNGNVVKSLLKQAGVSVLAGLLLSSAVLAEDTAIDAGEVTVDVEIGPEIGVEPGDTGVDESVDEGTVEDGISEGVEAPDTGAIDDTCADCSGMPEVSIDPMEMTGEPVAMEDGMGITASAGQGGPTPTGEPSRSVEYGGGRDNDLAMPRKADLK